jgi:hypothetical protein
VASLPAERNESSVQNARAGASIAELIYQGKDLKEIAAQLYPENSKKARRHRREFISRVYELAAWDQDFQSALVTRSKAILTLSLPAVTERLVTRARRLGKPQEVKLVFEASGFHNPRVQHDHSGSVEIKLTIPRPELPEKAKVVDAEAVEVSDP